jgi:ATP-dependent DNA helicase DinG
MNNSDNLNEKEKNLAFIDLETTGLSLKSEILEIGLVLVSQPDFKIIEEWDIKVKPQHLETADKEALLISGYNDKDWKNAVDIKSALNQFLMKVKDALIIGHNVNWDLMWLRKAIEDNGFEEKFARRSLDTISIAYAKLYKIEPEIKYFSLSNLAKYFGIEETDKHRALADAKTTYEIFKKLMEL